MKNKHRKETAMRNKDIMYAVWLPDVRKFAGWDEDFPSTPATPVEIENTAIMETSKEAWALAGLMNFYGYAANVVEIDVEKLERDCAEAGEVKA